MSGDNKGLEPGEQPYDGLMPIRIGLLAGGIVGIIVGIFVGASVWLMIAGALIGAVIGVVWHRRTSP